ncbi:oxaloacetate decarboxylase [Streptomyces solisilvae]|uniref:isocitrate lyase/PEP mutase family protein n=1 Tax=Streptomyces malaysiensis TaxID=92644 RepID=UPI00369FDD8D
MTSRGSRLRALLERRSAMPVPGAANALTARIIEDEGFDAVYVTGAGIANTFLGVPDVGLTTLTEVASHVAAIRDVVDLPLIVDADTGFGNVVNTRRAVRLLEGCGADAIQLEDQTFPKRCGHFAGKSVIPLEEMVDKISAACAARTSPDVLLIARTDARAEYGIAEACMRANAYREAGADVLFVEAPQSDAEIAQIAEEIPGLVMLNIVEGGVTAAPSFERLQELGYAMTLYANHPLLATIAAVRGSLAHIRSGDRSPMPGAATWSERQRLVRRDWFEDFERKHSTADR